MFLGFLGLLMIVIIVWALIQSKTNPVPIFVIVPIIAQLLPVSVLRTFLNLSKPVFLKPGLQRYYLFSLSYTSL